MDRKFELRTVVTFLVTLRARTNVLLYCQSEESHVAYIKFNLPTYPPTMLNTKSRMTIKSEHIVQYFSKHMSIWYPYENHT